MENNADLIAQCTAKAQQWLSPAFDEKTRKEMMIAAISSVANTCILTMQDLIGLGKEARMNIPSTVGNNWKWRATKEQFSEDSRNFLAHFTHLYGRA